MVGLIIFLFFALLTLLIFTLLVCNAVFTLEYSSPDGLVLTARILFVKIRLYPKKEKHHKKSMSRKQAARIQKKLDKKAEKKRQKRAEKEAEKKERREAKAAAKKKKKKLGDAHKIIDILHLAISIIGHLRHRFLKHLRIKFARIRITVGTEDAATTAVIYGAVTQSINILFPLLEDIKNFKFPTEEDLQINADFTAEESVIDLKISLCVRIIHVLHFAIRSLIELVKYYFKRQERESENGEASQIKKTNKNSPAKKGI